MSNAPLSGLVLAGGHSRRMRKDKATLDFNGETQLARAARLLSAHVGNMYVSVRPDQTTEPERARWPQIVDRIPDIGPVAGILAALDHQPHHAWLVVAVDLPMLDVDTLERLMRLRNPHRLATAFLSDTDGLPEPLCAIWEPASRQPLADFVTGGKNCPRKFLLNHPVELLTLTSRHALSNINTPDEYVAAIDSSREMKS
jgi:molybdopterin-guanine dinucleotide biosynthesis protein A